MSENGTQKTIAGNSRRHAKMAGNAPANMEQGMIWTDDLFNTLKPPSPRISYHHRESKVPPHISQGHIGQYDHPTLIPPHKDEYGSPSGGGGHESSGNHILVGYTHPVPQNGLDNQDKDKAMDTNGGDVIYTTRNSNHADSNFVKKQGGFQLHKSSLVDYHPRLTNGIDGERQRQVSPDSPAGLSNDIVNYQKVRRDSGGTQSAGKLYTSNGLHAKANIQAKRHTQPPGFLDLNGKRQATNGYREEDIYQNTRYDTISGLSVKLTSQRLGDSYPVSMDTKDTGSTRSGSKLSHGYDSSLITRTLEAQGVHSPASSASSTPVKIPRPQCALVEQYGTTHNHRGMNGFVHSQKSPTNQDLQLHHARQVYIRTRSASLEHDYLRPKSCLASPSSPLTTNGDHSLGEMLHADPTPPSTPSTPSSSYSDTVHLPQPSSSHKRQTLKQNLQTISESINSFFRPLKQRGKCKSEGDLLQRSNSTPDCLDDESGDLTEDQDDYGFLSYPSFRSLHHSFNHSHSSSSSTAMQKGTSASSSGGSRLLLPRRWRQKSKTPGMGSPAVNAKGISSALWKPEVSFCSFTIIAW